MAPKYALDIDVQSDRLRLSTADRSAFDAVVACLRQARGYRLQFTDHPTATAWAESLFDEADIDVDRCVCKVEAWNATRCEMVCVGILELVLTEPQQATIALFVVSSSSRLQGVGRGAVRLLAQHLWHRGYKRLNLGVSARNTSALVFWESLGFSEISALGTEREKLLTMEARLVDILNDDTTQRAHHPPA